jgi:DNA polymerase sigma
MKIIMEEDYTFEPDFIPFDDSNENFEDQRAVKLFDDHENQKINPWMKYSSKIDSFALRLHTEIIEFYDFIRPKQDEISLRNQTVSEVKEFIQVKAFL